MSSKNDAEVIIAGKVFTISGYESKEYLQKVAAYINGKLEEFNNNESFRRTSAEVRTNLMYLNIADDYFKARKIGDDLQEELDIKVKEIYDLKHDLIKARMENEAALKEIKTLEDEKEKFKKNIVKLETELQDMKK